MMAQITTTPAWWWGAFVLFILAFLAVDLKILHRNPSVVSYRQALRWSVFWATLAMLFAVALVFLRNREESVEFITGYLIELSLSMDNVFIIALLFAYFRVAPEFQHRVLFWGILGALVMRGILIGVGAELISHYQWVLYLLGLFLLFAGIKMLFTDDRPVEPEKNPVMRLARKILPIYSGDHGGRMRVKVSGKTMLTSLALVLLMIEITDLVFALDSIPAIFAVTTKPFIVFTSNVFAILGLRSLYFLLAGAMGYFRYLKVGLAIVLVFVAVKMLLSPHGESQYWFQVEIPTLASLATIAAILAATMLLSITAARREKQTADAPK